MSGHHINLTGSAALIAVIAAMGLLVWSLSDRGATGVLDIAQAQVGIYHYRVDFEERVVGRYESRIQLRDGRVIFSSKLSAALPGADPLEVDEQLVFASAGDYRLLEATQERRSSGTITRVELLAADDGYQATLRRNGQRQIYLLDWRYQLADHMSVEHWLSTGQPRPDAVHSSRQLDLNRFRPLEATWRLLGVDADGGTLLTLAAGGEDSLFQLDRDFVARAMSLGGVFTMTRVAGAVDIPAPGPLTHSRLAMVPLDAPLDDPGSVSLLRLGINASAASALDGTAPITGSVSGSEASWQLELGYHERPPASPAEIDQASGPSVDLPADHPRIRRAAHRAVRGIESSDSQIAALTRYVHELLEYQDDVSAATILETLDARVGDCTEFAGLLTTLARALGLPARTVTGLAYAEADGPGFYLHAWTEIVSAGRWVAVDPTFGRTRIGPTHIRFPDARGAHLRAYAAIPEMQFDILAVAHDTETPSAF